MFKVGIIGNGYVGSSVAHGFSSHTDVYAYDIDPDKTINSFEAVMECEFIFICVPTPMNISDENKADLSLVKNVFYEISKYFQSHPHDGHIFILKSTVIPNAVKSLCREFPNLEIVFNPEFLREASARLDFINASRIVLGGSKKSCERVTQLYRARFPYTPIISTDEISAEFVKYMCNCFFATKLSFMNEMHQVSQKLGLNWDDIMKTFILDGRIGNTHIDVPGRDGYLGFGGKCFPKDINAFINFFEDCGVKPSVLSAVWEKNLEVREKADWENIKGAISGHKKTD
tara:strand:- start:890 stop:1750 length:861 start_codon:yes stop_codon:yes gene_type:complete